MAKAGLIKFTLFDVFNFSTSSDKEFASRSNFFFSLETDVYRDMETMSSSVSSDREPSESLSLFEHENSDHKCKDKKKKETQRTRDNISWAFAICLLRFNCASWTSSSRFNTRSSDSANADS